MDGRARCCTSGHLTTINNTTARPPLLPPPLCSASSPRPPSSLLLSICSSLRLSLHHPDLSRWDSNRRLSDHCPALSVNIASQPLSASPSLLPFILSLPHLCFYFYFLSLSFFCNKSFFRFFPPSHFLFSCLSLSPDLFSATNSSCVSVFLRIHKIYI